jgi:Flp pilus assembly pilin Flp
MLETFIIRTKEIVVKILRNESGQGMTEYIIIVALIAIAAIAGFSYFGKTVRTQTAAMSESLAGDAGKAKVAVAEAGKAADGAVSSGKKDINLKTYVEEQN